MFTTLHFSGHISQNTTQNLETLNPTSCNLFIVPRVHAYVQMTVRYATFNPAQLVKVYQEKLRTHSNAAYPICHILHKKQCSALQSLVIFPQILLSWANDLGEDTNW